MAPRMPLGSIQERFIGRQISGLERPGSRSAKFAPQDSSRQVSGFEKFIPLRPETASVLAAIRSRVALCYHTSMSQPVKLSDALVLDARLVGEVVERSIAGQVEFWARLGRSVELLLEGQQVLTLCRNAATQPLSKLLETVDSPAGRSRVAAYLQSQPFPHYRPYAGRSGLLERIDEDGSRTVGRFVNRKFKRARLASKTAATGT